jgi:hypothetical protein
MDRLRGLRPWMGPMSGTFLGRALAKIAIDEAERYAIAASDPHRAHSYAIQLGREERKRAARDAEAAALAKMEARYLKRYEAKKAAELKAATCGPGWKALDRDHRALEALAHHHHELAFHATP